MYQQPEPMEKLTKDLKEAAKTLTLMEVRYLVDLYYQIQDFRIQAQGQQRSMKETGEPVQLINWVFESQKRVEEEIRKALDIYTDVEPTGLGVWSKAIYGIGPVISAGLLAHIELEPWVCMHNKTKGDKKCHPDKPHGPECHSVRIETAGHIWRFGGLDPSVKWEKGKKRPWNAKLKVLLFKAGESFVKVQNNDKDIYGHMFAKRKAEEIVKNFSGLYRAQAERTLKEKNYDKSTESYRWYAGCLSIDNAQKLRSELEMIPPVDPNLTGKDKQKAKAAQERTRKQLFDKYCGEPGTGVPMLPPAHIHGRARRWTIKLFISHWFEEAYRRRYGKEPPAPYPIAILGHAHKLERPRI